MNIDTHGIIDFHQVGDSRLTAGVPEGALAGPDDGAQFQQVPVAAGGAE